MAAHTMTSETLRRLREGRNWSQAELAELLNAALERNYESASIGRWETGARKVPKDVSAYLEVLALQTALPGVDPADQLYGPQEEPDGDSAPPDPNPAPEPPVGQQPYPGAANGYERLCTELFEMVATGVGMVGAVLGSEPLMRDGAIIDADKEALGRAYGKLAQTNETFRRMLQSMTTSGAWLEVALVSGTTAGKLWRNHATPIVAPAAEPPTPLVVIGHDGEVRPA